MALETRLQLLLHSACFYDVFNAKSHRSRADVNIQSLVVEDLQLQFMTGRELIAQVSQCIVGKNEATWVGINWLTPPSSIEWQTPHMYDIPSRKHTLFFCLERASAVR